MALSAADRENLFGTSVVTYQMQLYLIKCPGGRIDGKAMRKAFADLSKAAFTTAIISLSGKGIISIEGDDVVIDPDKVMAQADREVVGTAANYVFSKCSSGKPLDIKVARPEVKFDYSFMVLPEGRFAQDNSIPDGIVYQIQMFLLSSPATVSQLKGLSPVFSEKTPTGKYIYRVGLFRTYNDVLANLKTVKRLGFRSAFIVAFNDGEQLSVHKARELEAGLREREARYQVRIVSPGEALPDITLKAIRQVTDRDIAKAVEDGKTVFLVGPLDSEADAGKLCTMVRISGIDEVETVKIEN